MKKLLLLFVICCVSLVSIGRPLPPPNKHLGDHLKKETYVYLCNSSAAYAYHSTTSCKGLSRCNHGIIKVTLSEAVNKYGRRACKICE